MSGLDDGIYEVVVVDASERPDGAIALELAVSSGPHRGDVVELTATGLRRHWVDLLAAPATLTVDSGEPSLRFD